MSKFIELPKGESNVLINTDNIIFITPDAKHPEKTDILFGVDIGDVITKGIIVDIDYESLKVLLLN